MGCCPKWSKSLRTAERHRLHDSKIGQSNQFKISKISSAANSQSKTEELEIVSLDLHCCI